ncbi:ABC transporter ATP-binding protein [Paenimyroides tangerinum]|uniref:ABC transporter ATP-binding protein n=1 Tax=Paenimyroides tangerinum TaxID=2488728 RepID=A0A3P3W1Y3_9FLAO|nr:ABC transporter ATP-binding protein [Paenimyroides tangerinum]RRJ89071.1 ABC transporter ATP-binding protein [Paenimyroides tangerinum]
MIKVNNLSKIYNGYRVLNIEHLEIQKGESFGLVGNNGAGKTTFFSLLLDLIQPSTGNIVSNGIEIHTSEKWKTFTNAFLDESFLIGYLTPDEYFNFIGELRGLSKEETLAFVKPFQVFFNDEILGGKKYIRDLSKGNQKKVGIAATFIGNPEVVILDEPFANLDPTTQIRLKNLLKEIADRKQITMLISSHDLQHTIEVSNRIVALEKGKIVKDLITNENTMAELEALFSI